VADAPLEPLGPAAVGELSSSLDPQAEMASARATGAASQRADARVFLFVVFVMPQRVPALSSCAVKRLLTVPITVWRPPYTGCI
jgi:hypothetical protein